MKLCCLPYQQLFHAADIKNFLAAKRQTLEGAISALHKKMCNEEVMLSLEERKLKVEEDRLALDRERFEKVELIKMELELEDRRRRTILEEERAREREARDQRDHLHLELLKKLLEKI